MLKRFWTNILKSFIRAVNLLFLFWFLFRRFFFVCPGVRFLRCFVVKRFFSHVKDYFVNRYMFLKSSRFLFFFRFLWNVVVLVLIFCMNFRNLRVLIILFYVAALLFPCVNLKNLHAASRFCLQHYSFELYRLLTYYLNLYYIETNHTHLWVDPIVSLLLV